MRYFELMLEAASTRARRLYHGTSIYYLLAIISDDVILGNRGTYGDEGHAGVSLSRSAEIAIRFAKHQELFAEQNMLADAGTEPPPHGHCEGAVIVFDRASLNTQTGFIRYSVDDYNGEQEERTFGDIRPALASAIAIHVADPDLDWYEELAHAGVLEPFAGAVLAKLRNSSLRKRK